MNAAGGRLIEAAHDVALGVLDGHDDGRRLFFSFGAELFRRGIRRRFTALRAACALALLALLRFGADGLLQVVGDRARPPAGWAR